MDKRLTLHGDRKTKNKNTTATTRTHNGNKNKRRNHHCLYEPGCFTIGQRAKAEPRPDRHVQSEILVSIRSRYHVVACVVCYVAATMSLTSVTNMTSTVTLSAPGNKIPQAHPTQPSPRTTCFCSNRHISFSRPYMHCAWIICAARTSKHKLTVFTPNPFNKNTIHSYQTLSTHAVYT